MKTPILFFIGLMLTVSAYTQVQRPAHGSEGMGDTTKYLTNGFGVTSLKFNGTANAAVTVDSSEFITAGRLADTAADIRNDLSGQSNEWLQLTPSESPPEEATGGAIYYDTDGHFYGYNGIAWFIFDNKPDSLPFEITFDNLSSANDLISANAGNVENWNTFFDLPNYGNKFTSVASNFNTIRLYGASNIAIKVDLFNSLGSSIIAINDPLGCITEIGASGFNGSFSGSNIELFNLNSIITADTNSFHSAFSQASSLNEVSFTALTTVFYSAFYSAFYSTGLVSLSFPSLTTIEDNGFTEAFYACASLASISFPVLDSIGNSCFSMAFAYTIIDTLSFPVLTFIGDNAFSAAIYDSSVESIEIPSCTSLGSSTGDDGVFEAISGFSLSLTVPAALMSCNSGNPDGDIQYLQANNTVTVVTVP